MEHFNGLSNLLFANELVIAVICLVDNKLTSDSEQYKRVLRIFVKS